MRHTTHHTPAGAAAATPAAPVPGRLRAWCSTAVGALGTLGGLAPHVLHHIGPLAGTALLAGAGGTALFGALGFVVSIPMLLRLRRRYRNWWAPAIALALFAAMFSLSAFVIGPAISDGGGGGAPADSPAPTNTDHTGHHG
ncbi:hypothetical protein [Actinoplanes campanulatus]|nr:hypothetical protein [Actinoplanes capillaceus]